MLKVIQEFGKKNLELFFELRKKVLSGLLCMIRAIWIKLN